MRREELEWRFVFNPERRLETFRRVEKVDRIATHYCGPASRKKFHLAKPIIFPEGSLAVR